MSSIDLSKYQKQSPHKPSQTDGNDSSLTEKLSNTLNKDITLFEKKFGQTQKEALYSELGLLLSSGIDIKTALEIIEDQLKIKKHKAIISQIKEDIISGQSVWEALHKHNNVFSVYEYQSVKIGEESGKLPEVLIELGKFYTSSIKLRRQIISTLTYPAVVLTMSVLIVQFMLSFVVPMFTDIFKHTGAELPATTQLLIKLSAKSGLIFYSLIAIVIAGFLIHKTQQHKIWFRKHTAQLLLRVPVVNELIRKIYLARFCQSMKLLLGSKVLLIDALDLVKNMIGYYPIEHALDSVIKDVYSGKQLHESLALHTIFPKKLVSLIKVSEEVNAPELIFEKLNQQYAEEIEHQQLVIGKVIEPLFLVILGGLVGFILVSMYTPLFKMSSGIEGM
ncbi:MAG: type II secretion system F family protein [Sphingobacteriaceae bacterium]|nr:type II secretion system F family protein [Sphingobacteriaceae bacterium]